MNFRKHGVDFSDAARMFEDPYHLPRLERMVEGEECWQTIGMSGNVLLLLVAHTVEDVRNEEYVRIISARKANARERKLYEESH